MLQTAERDHQAALQERDALRDKNSQQKAELQQSHITVQQLQSAAAGLVDDLQSARSAAGRHVGQHTALRELAAEHDACVADLAAKSSAIENLNAGVAQLQAELAASTAQQAQHDQDSTEQQATFVGQVTPFAVFCCTANTRKVCKYSYSMQVLKKSEGAENVVALFTDFVSSLRHC